MKKISFLFSVKNECSFSDCQHICVDKKIGYECVCHPGYQPHPTIPKFCIDINECKNRPCSQICSNDQGSYNCSCTKGYKLMKDKHSCSVDGKFLNYKIHI